MNTPNKSIAIIFILLTFILNSCSSEETKYIPPTLVNFPETGLIGQPIVIEVENVQIGKLQVFFDSEEAQVHYVSDKEIMVIVPRTIKTNTPTLKVIDLNENKTILNKTFSLKKPVITKYSGDKITFNETFTIYGENFDVLKDFISVFVNNEKATIINVDYNKIEIQIPNKIITANLEIKVRAQLQEVTSTLPLLLESPMISGINNSSAWIRSQLIVFGKNFNPNSEFGEVFINDIPCFFSVSDNKLSIDIPPGPYQDFKITNVTYKTAGLTSSYDCTVPILNDAILVDHTDKGSLQHTIFKHNNKAYTFKYIDDGSHNFNYKYSLLEFSPITEKWTELSTFKYTGYLADAVFDGNNTVYLYKKSQATQEFSLTKLNLNTFQEVAIDLPYGNKIFNPILFAYQDNLYILSGLNIIDGQVTTRNQKYKYSVATNSWSVLSSSAFSTLPLVSPSGSGKCNYLFHGNNIYISYGIIGGTHKINSNLSVTDYSFPFSFEYSNAIISQQRYYDQYIFYNIITNASKIKNEDNLFDYDNSFFTLNNEIYYIKNSWTSYYQNTYYTQKLRKEILNGLL
jgi:hypothetical protein